MEKTEKLGGGVIQNWLDDDDYGWFYRKGTHHEIAVSQRTRKLIEDGYKVKVKVVDEKKWIQFGKDFAQIPLDLSGCLSGFSRIRILNEIVAVGTPLVKIESGFQGSTRIELDAQKRSEYLVVIDFDGQNYRWKTRENKISTYLKVESSTRFTLLTAQVMWK